MEAVRKIHVNTTNEVNGDTLSLLERLKNDLPQVWPNTQIVGQWVWLEFNVPPHPEVRSKLKHLGFHWNAGRKSWQPPCGESRPRSRRDPKVIYEVIPACDVVMNETPQKSNII